MSKLVHVNQCLVKESNRIGEVEAIIKMNPPQAKIQWFHPQAARSQHLLSDLKSGFINGFDVITTSKQEGIIIAKREIGGSEQHLVEFPETGKKAWLPYQHLKQIDGVKNSLLTGHIEGENAAELLRLKTLAYALTKWDNNTGALSSLEIDPLPHQIHLVNHIINSGNLNWLIADDVGLGKTIETGMLLQALKRRDAAKRILLITPSGLTRQWQEEMYEKFGLDEFKIYGENFTIDNARGWKMYDHVIASIDKVKREEQLELLLQAEPWDMVIFDEAHRLTRTQIGMHYQSSERYKLAAELRKYDRAKSILMLTATPHQGKQDQFTALLELLRPERTDDIRRLSLNPEILGEMMIRNHKEDVTDAEGNFIFKGKTTHNIVLQTSPQAKAFDNELKDYFRRGYLAASNNPNKQQARAIGFVMTIYRKLAVSSVAAIHLALERRLARIKKEFKELTNKVTNEQDDRFAGEYEESYITDEKQFFNGEIDLLKNLIQLAAELKINDLKIQSFIDELLGTILSNNSNEKVLIFTEYRSTQVYLQLALSKKVGEGKINLIHGGMPLKERQASIINFESEGQFLISTEAGGEGINLQRHCHIMVNYDLPWNPMRLVQRVGRLYRYGQKKPVLVFNMSSKGSMDDNIVSLMYQRIDQVVIDLSVVQDAEYNENLRDQILGEVVCLTDLEDILKNSRLDDSIQRTQERIDDALELAKAAVNIQKDLFQYATSFNPNKDNLGFIITNQHIQAFVIGMCTLLGIKIESKTHHDKVWHLRLPDNIRDELRIKKTLIDISFDREICRLRNDIQMMDTDSKLLNLMIDKAKSYQFNGKTALVNANIDGEIFVAGQLCWQNTFGKRMQKEFITLLVKDNQVLHNPKEISDWLLTPAKNGISQSIQNVSDKNKELLSIIENAVDHYLKKQSNGQLLPERFNWISAAWLK